MKKTLLILSVLLLNFGILSSVHAHQSESDVITVDEIVRVYDGDTITVNIDAWPALLGKEIGIRVRGIDTPEIRGECEYEKVRAKLARDFAEQVLREAQSVQLVSMERGKYFRIVADVMHDGKSLAYTLMEHGYGRPYTGGSREGWCD